MNKKFNVAAGLVFAALMGSSALASDATTYVMTDNDFKLIHAGIDNNKDGVITRAEYAAYYNRRFDGWDASRTGSPTNEEIATSLFERELRKTDGNPMGNSPLPGSVQK